MSRKLPKVVYYLDETQEFEDNHLERKDLPNDYEYICKNKFTNFFWNIIYAVGSKLLFVFSKLFLKVKVKNRKKLKKLKHKGFFIYMNHTSDRDPFIIQSTVLPFRKTYIIGYTDAYNIPVVGKLIPHIGLLPLPNNIRGLKKFSTALEELTVEKNKPVIIFPERQMWPYCSRIRPFNNSSFHYPADFNVPIVPMVTIYKKNNIIEKFDLKPIPVIVVCDPIYPQKDLSMKENKDYLYKACLDEMNKVIEKYASYEYVKYIKTDDFRTLRNKKNSLKKYYKVIKQQEKLKLDMIRKQCGFSICLQSYDSYTKKLKLLNKN